MKVFYHFLSFADSCARSPVSSSQPPARSNSLDNRVNSAVRSTREAGIEAVFQNLALADDLDVPSNIFLGREERVMGWLGPFSFLNERKMVSRAQKALESTGVKIPDLRSLLRHMSGGRIHDNEAGEVCGSSDTASRIP